MSKKSSAVNTMHQQARMLKALEASYGNVSRAAKATRITRQTHYNWYRQDEAYAEKVNLLKHECHEEFKDLVREGIRKKVIEGNTTILALCYRTLFNEKVMANEEIHNPFRERLRAKIRYVDLPPERKEMANEMKQRPNPFSPEGIMDYDRRLAEQRKGRMP